MLPAIKHVSVTERCLFTKRYVSYGEIRHFLCSVISPGKVVALDRWGGKWNHLSMTHRLTTNCVKNYCNRTLIVKVIVENVVTCFFWDTVYYIMRYCKCLLAFSKLLIVRDVWLPSLRAQNSSSGPVFCIMYSCHSLCCIFNQSVCHISIEGYAIIFSFFCVFIVSRWSLFLSTWVGNRACMVLCLMFCQCCTALYTGIDEMYENRLSIDIL